MIVVWHHFPNEMKTHKNLWNLEIQESKNYLNENQKSDLVKTRLEFQDQEILVYQGRQEIQVCQEQQENQVFQENTLGVQYWPEILKLMAAEGTV